MKGKKILHIAAVAAVAGTLIAITHSFLMSLGIMLLLVVARTLIYEHTH